jgi:hypothetical protein
MKRKPAPGMTNQGVRNLNEPAWKKTWKRELAAATTPKPPSKPVDPAALQDEPLCDLIYDRSQEINEEILALWPDAKLDPTYDWIHDWRTEVAIPRCSRMNWYKFLVRTGLGQISFSFQLALLQETELIEAAMDSEAPGWRNRTKGAKR